MTHKLAITKSPRSASLLMSGRFRLQTVPTGRTIMARSKMKPGSDWAWKKSWISKQRPPGVVLSHFKIQNTVSVSVANVFILTTRGVTHPESKRNALETR